MHSLDCQRSKRTKRENKQNKKRAAHFLAVFFAVIVKLDWNDHAIVAALWSSLHPIDDIDVDRRDFHWFRRKYP